MDRTITMRRLGEFGQWGNQLIQYAFVRTYARIHRLDYQVPPWAGQYFFGLRDPPITTELPIACEQYRIARVKRFGIPLPPEGDEWAGRDFEGWAQYHTSWYRPDKRFIQGLFWHITEPSRDKYTGLARKLRARGKTVIGLHIRRGENGRLIYLLTPIGWCLRWLYENWRRFDDPVLFIATDEKEFAEPFAGYDPVLIENLGYEYDDEPPPLYKYPHGVKPFYQRQMNFFGDWWLLRHCDVVLASESTYSFTAAWLNPRNREFWWPRLSIGGFERVDPWDTHVSPREFVDDYPEIPGIMRDENPDWEWDGRENAHDAVPEDPASWERWSRPPKG